MITSAVVINAGEIISNKLPKQII